MQSPISAEQQARQVDLQTMAELNCKYKSLPTEEDEEEEWNDDTTCGIGRFRSRFLQQFANKKAFVFLYGTVGCIFGACYSYFNGIITTLEKRFKIPSKTTGFISVGDNVSQLLLGMILSYYAGRGHRPRWIALGLYTVVLYCLLNATPHILFGPGSDALALTREYGASVNPNETSYILEQERRKSLCQSTADSECDVEDGRIAPQVIFFIANFASGIGGFLYYTLGATYLDDNIKKSKTPLLLSFTFFLRMLGPAAGFALASLCLKFYISPNMTPTIRPDDPRWLGAWWIGWLFLASVLFVMASLLGLYPKHLPRAARRKMKEKKLMFANSKAPETYEKTSLSDMVRTYRRLFTNKTLLSNNLSTVFYTFGEMPYSMFMPKYIETQYRQSASVANFITGPVGLTFSAIGILLSGFAISKWKPRARILAGWNVVVGIVSVLGMITYIFLGCTTNDHALLPSGELSTRLPCNADCRCDYVKYSPVCAKGTTFISPCHAGCRNSTILDNGTQLLSDCSCVVGGPEDSIMTSDDEGGVAVLGSCPIDCAHKFGIFIAVACLIKFMGASGRTSNFLVSVRCVEVKDKPMSMAFTLFALNLFAFIPSQILFGILLGIISVGGDISMLMVSMVLSYYAGRGHRPRWIAVSLLTVVLSCLMNAAPHFFYGPGNDALAFTLEHGDRDGIGVNQTQDNRDEDKLCKLNGGVGCDDMEGSVAPQVILFLASFVGGIGGPLYYTVGTAYMDDNIKKSKTPVLISFSYFLRMLGPSAGYALASVCLKYYISPTLTPYITPKDPRWLGAWWIGWLVFAVVMASFSFLIALFPKQLPRAAVRKMLEKERLKESGGENGLKGDEEETERTSFTDMMKSFRRLITNPTLTCNNLAALFYIFGYMPYWIFMPKYIETQYHQSASTSSLITGTVGLLFSAIGVLVSGFVLSKFKPSARIMAGWNVFVGVSSAAGVISYMFLGCPASDRAIDFIVSNAESSCSANCHCDYVMYSPVCTLDESTSFISACHAGCTTSHTTDNGTVLYTDCSCVPGNNSTFGSVRGGFCPVDCFKAFVAFLSIVCLLKFIGASGRATNFLVSVRCVDEKDKTMSMALGVTMLSIGSFIPSPIFFGYLVDKTCLVWGKTCSGTGNCWLYNGEALRFLLNITSAGFLLVGTLFDVAVWYYVKDLSIFDDKEKAVEIEATQQSMILEERRKSCIE